MDLPQTHRFLQPLGRKRLRPRTLIYMIQMKKLISRYILSAALLLTTITGAVAQQDNNFELSKNVEIYIDLLRQLNTAYAENINPGDLNTTAIDAMLANLDPYTVYVPESRLEDFELMTKGEYGGIGALIQQQDDYVIITEPYADFPAYKSGLRAGDKILTIAGESAKGKTSGEVSERLKGVPGSELNLEILSYGDTIPRMVTVVREKIKIPNIPFSGMLSNDIGYISLSQFNPGAAVDVQKAFATLAENNSLKGLILDLRGNGGGLMNEAVDLANTFVPKGELIVTTKGKTRASTQVHYTRNKVIDKTIPLVVLVDENSASASEIMAGAMQDLDRGVVVGTQTFGKGLVQNIVALPYNSKLKITVAKYYIPSGRCIQAIDYFHQKKPADSTKKADSLGASFKTRNGRVVYEGKGIAPDIVTKPRMFSQISGDLYAGNYIFRFANEFVLLNDSIPPVDDFYISDSLYSGFKSFVAQQDFDYLTETEAVLKQLVASAERESYLNAVNNQLSTLGDLIAEEKKNDLDKHRSEIEEMLRVEIVTRYYHQPGKIQAALQNDPEIETAINILSDPSKYKAILSGQQPN